MISGPRHPLLFAAAAAGAAALIAVGRRSDIAQASPATGDPNTALRCRNQTSIALAGRLPTAEEIAAGDREAVVDGLLSHEDFREHFASFLMRELNNVPSEETYQDALYLVALEVLKTNRPWSSLFNGAFGVRQSPATGRHYVYEDPQGLGYFRTPGWIQRYPGNEAQGVRLTAAYRMLNNLTGIRLTAVNNANATDVSKKGREASGCRSCHYDGWAPLDPVASILGARRGTGLSLEILPPAPDAVAVVGGRAVRNDRELVERLLSSEDYPLHMCDLMFHYVYGRAASSCEAPVVDACVATLKATDSAPMSLRGLVLHGGFCS